MERYTPAERGIIVTDYLSNFRSVVLTQREFVRRFPQRLPPGAQTIKRLADRLVQTGTTEDMQRSGRPRSARSAKNITAVAEHVRESPQISMRQRSAQFGISRRSLYRIMVKDLKMFPNASPTDETQSAEDGTVVKTEVKLEATTNSSDMITIKKDEHKATTKSPDTAAPRKSEKP